jgi:hypothetical protein
MQAGQPPLLQSLSSPGDDPDIRALGVSLDDSRVVRAVPLQDDVGGPPQDAFYVPTSDGESDSDVRARVLGGTEGGYTLDGLPDEPALVQAGTSIGLSPAVAAGVGYLFLWLGGAGLVVLEKKNLFVLFNGWQSLVLGLMFLPLQVRLDAFVCLSIRLKTL